MKFEKPIPLKTLDNKPYWDAADAHKLVIQKCNGCQHYNHPPGPACAKCGSMNLTWEELGNEITGKIYSYIISYRPFLPGFSPEDMPLIIALATLDQIPSVKILANVIGCVPAEISIGKKVKMVWVDVPNTERALPQWKLID